jgi:hypothetical protein
MSLSGIGSSLKKIHFVKTIKAQTIRREQKMAIIPPINAPAIGYKRREKKAIRRPIKRPPGPAAINKKIITFFLENLDSLRQRGHFIGCQTLARKNLRGLERLWQCGHLVISDSRLGWPWH